MSEPPPHHLGCGHSRSCPPLPTKEDRLVSYLYHVIGLANGITEEESEVALWDEARQQGIDPDAELHAWRGPASPVESSPRRGSQDSEYSKTSSYSTGFNSTFSTEFPAYKRHSLSVRDYDAFLSLGTSDRQSISFSPPTTPSHSVFSLPFTSPPESPPKKHFRMIRGLSRLALGRSSSSSSSKDACPHCPQCPQDSFRRHRARHRLPCGHRLCGKALRSTILNATEGVLGAVPNCCGIPIPDELLQLVANQDEQTSLVEKLEEWNASAFPSRRPSLSSGRRDSHAPSLPHPIITDGKFICFDGHNSTKTSDPRAPPASEQDPSLAQCLVHDDYTSLHADQIAQRDCFQDYLTESRAALQAYHAYRLGELIAAHAVATNALVDDHDEAILRAEDKQVSAEALLRDAQEREKRGNATALKYMVAYCNGTYARDGQPHGRVVTDGAHEELEKMKRIGEGLPLKHENAINVLRGEQGRWMKERMRKRDLAVADLEKAQEVERCKTEEKCRTELASLDTELNVRRESLKGRWWIQMAVLRARMMKELGIQVEARLPCAEFEEEPFRQTVRWML